MIHTIFLTVRGRVFARCPGIVLPGKRNQYRLFSPGCAQRRDIRAACCVACFAILKAAVPCQGVRGADNTVVQSKDCVEFCFPIPGQLVACLPCASTQPEDDNGQSLLSEIDAFVTGLADTPENVPRCETEGCTRQVELDFYKRSTGKCMECAIKVSF